MREKKLNIAIDSLNQIIYFYVCFCIITPILYSITGSIATALLSIFLLPILFASYLIALLSKQVILFFVLHAVIILMNLYLLPNIYAKVLLIATTLVFMLINLLMRISEKTHMKSNISGILLSLVVVSQMICNKFHYDFMNPYIMYGLLICTLIFCLTTYLVNYRNYYINNHEKINIPLRQIERPHHILLGIFLGFVGLLMFLISRLPLQSYLNQFGNLLVRLIRKLVSFIRFHPSEVEESTVEEEVIPSELVIPEDYFPDKEHPILDFIYQFVYILMVIIAIAAIVAFVSYICYRIYQGFHAQAKRATTDTKEFISPFTTKKEKERQRDNEKPRSFFLFATNRDKIRKHFYQQLKPNINVQKAPYYTSNEMTQSVNTETSGLLVKTYSEEELTKLHLLYDKARYSNEECSKEDYHNIKKIHLQ